MGLISIYRDHEIVYKADTCESLVNAAGQGRIRLSALARGGYPGRRLAAHDLPGLRSTGLWDAVGAQDWGLDWHRNEGIEITLLETGSLPFHTSRREFLMQPGDLALTPPWQPHRLGNPHIKAGRLIWMILDVGVRRPNQNWKWPKWIVLKAKDMERLSQFLRQNDRPVWKASPEILQCFKRIGHVVETEDHEQTISRLAVSINELLLGILEMFQHRLTHPDPEFSGNHLTIQLFFDDLQSHTEQLAQPWTVESMAKECGMGVTSFIHYCKQITNLTPGKYLNRLRLEAATRLLRADGGRSVTDIAYACGFSSSQYFANLFRRQYHATPMEYRKMEG